MKQFDVVIVGAGMGGIYSLYKMKALGLSVQLLEAADGIGGTWHWNTYPGARVDVESLDYSFSFSDNLQKEFRWSEKFAAQPELVKYFEHVVDRFDLLQHIRLNARVTAARYDADAGQWFVAAAGEDYVAKYVIMATGLLSVPIMPKLPGPEAFKGEVYNTGLWPRTPVEFSGKRVALFGNGSSGIQVLPAVAKAGADITLFQRTAAYAVPVHNGPSDEADLDVILNHYEDRRRRTRESVVGTYWSAYETGTQSVFDVAEAEREAVFEEWWRKGGAGFVVAFNDLLTDLEANKFASDFVRRKIREIVKDPATAEKLVPSDELPIGCKRLPVENGYFEAFNRDNVHLVDMREEGIVGFRRNGIETTGGMREFDMVIFATGFDAFTGALLRMDVEGPAGPLKEKWREGPRNYLGMMIEGFPNLFMVNGPGTVASNFFLVTEVQGDWIANVIEHAETHNLGSVAVTRQGEEQWLEHINEVAETVTVSNHCDTWFRGTNIADKPVVVMNYLGGLGAYTQQLNAAASGFPQLVFARETEAA